MSTYNPPDKSVLDLVDAVLNKYEEHNQLVTAGVKIDVLMAYGKESKSGEKGDAIKHHGVKALGLMKRNGLKERVLGHGDALMLLDGDWFATASDAERKAVIDHELLHLDLKRDETFAVEADDADRPKLVLRPHDYELGEFILIAKRHGMASVECKMMAKIKEEAGQFFWPEIEEPSKLRIKKHSEDSEAADEFLNGVRQLSAAELANSRAVAAQ
jgi:hypothetical protein